MIYKDLDFGIHKKVSKKVSERSFCCVSVGDMTMENKEKNRGQDVKKAAIPTTFTPMFWKDLDGRVSEIKQVLRRYEKLRKDTGCDSVQKDLLCQRIAFLAVRIESMECQAFKSGEFDSGLFVSLCNSLVGMLRLIGINRRAKVESLQSYLKSQAKTKGQGA